MPGVSVISAITFPDVQQVEVPVDAVGSNVRAAAAGCALVLADIPTLRELWDGAAEFLNPCDSAQLHSALNLLIADSEKRSSRGARAVA